MNRIETLIFNELAAHRAVALPRVGTLRVVRHPARVVGGVVTPPHNFVVYSLETDGDMPTVLALGADDNEYAAWLAGAMHDGILRIEGVGTLILGEFTPSEELEGAINPSAESVAARVEKKEEPVLWVPASPNTKPNMKQYTMPNTRQDMMPNMRPGTMPEADERPRLDYYTEQFLRDEQRRHKMANVVLIVAGVLLLASWAYFFFGWFRPCEEHVVVTHEVVHVPVPAPAPAPVPEPVVEEPVVEEVAEPEYHLIAGSFRDPLQAERMAQRYKRSYPDLEVATLDNGSGRTLVSIYKSARRGEAYSKFYKLAERTGVWDMWVFEKMDN